MGRAVCRRGVRGACIVAAVTLASVAATVAAADRPDPANPEAAHAQLEELRQAIDRLGREAKSVAERRAAIERQLKIAEDSSAILARRIARLEEEAHRLERLVVAVRDAWQAAAARAERSRARYQALSEAILVQLPHDPVIRGGPESATASAEAVRQTLLQAVRDELTRAEKEHREAERWAARLQEEERVFKERREALERERAQWTLLAQQRKVLHEALAKTLSEVRDRRKALEEDAQALSRLIARLEAQAKRQALEEKQKRTRQTAKAERATPADEHRPKERPVAFASPVANGHLVGSFGGKRAEGGTWKGLFWSAPEGAQVRAVADGVVAFADWLRGYGQIVILDHGKGLLTLYANLDTPLVTVGEKVTRHQVVGRVGRTEHFATSGLYFELRQNGQPVDPSRWLKE